MPAKPRKIPQRQCVGCRTMKNKKDLIRVVKSPEGEIGLDFTGKKSGRGAYLCHDAACFAKAVRARRLQNALECEIPDQVIGAIEKELTVCDG